MVIQDNLYIYIFIINFRLEELGWFYMRIDTSRIKDQAMNGQSWFLGLWTQLWRWSFFHMNTMKLMFQASFFGREIQGIVLPQRCLKRPGEAMIGFFPPGDGEARPWRGSQTWSSSAPRWCLDGVGWVGDFTTKIWQRHVEVSIVMGVPQNGWFIIENPIRMHDN